MVVQYGTFLSDQNAVKEPNFAELICLKLSFDDEYIFRKFGFRREDIVALTFNIETAIAISYRIGPVP